MFRFITSCTLYTHSDHKCGLGVSNEDEYISIKAVLVYPGIKVGSHIDPRAVHQHHVVSQQGAQLPGPVYMH